MDAMKDFLRQTIEFNWDMLEINRDYFLNMKEMSTFQKIDELYDMFMYFLDKEDYEKCSVINDEIHRIRKIHLEEISKLHKEQSNGESRQDKKESPKQTAVGKSKKRR